MNMINKDDIKRLQAFQNNINKNDFIKAFLVFSIKKKSEEEAKDLANEIWDLYIKNHRNLIETINYLDDDSLSIFIDILNHLNKFN